MTHDAGRRTQDAQGTCRTQTQDAGYTEEGYAALHGHLSIKSRGREENKYYEVRDNLFMFT